MTVKLAMIAGVAENRVIGSDNHIPWRISSDMAFFKRTTMGKPIVMGRKQYESVGRALPGRTNLVVSRRPGYQPEGVIVINALDAAIDHALSIAAGDGVDEAMIIGGGEIYAQAMGRADRLYISHIALRPTGDVLFPPIESSIWREIEAPAVEPSLKDEASYRIAVYERIATAH
jgi:dihydrofolate reductase